MNKPKESNLQSKILNDLRSFGKHVVVFKLKEASDNGLPDIFFTSKITGPIFVELKRKGETPRRLQMFMINKLNKCGMKAFVCDDIRQWIKLKNKLNLKYENFLH